MPLEPAISLEPAGTTDASPPIPAPNQELAPDVEPAADQPVIDLRPSPSESTPTHAGRGYEHAQPEEAQADAPDQAAVGIGSSPVDDSLPALINDEEWLDLDPDDFLAKLRTIGSRSEPT